MAALADERGKREQTRKNSFLQNDSKYLPVILERSEESGQRMWVLHAFSITYAGFFAPSDNLFFLLLSFLFCPPLKNDGRVNCVSSKFLLGFCKKRQNGNRMPSPLVGEGGGEAVGRGECEQIRKNGNKCEQKRKNSFYRTVLNTRLSFLNEVKNLGRGCKYLIF